MNIGKWREFIVQENLEDHKISLELNARKIAKEVGAMPPKMKYLSRIGAYNMVFPYDPGSPGAALSVGGKTTMSGQQRKESAAKALRAAQEFVEFVKQDGSPVDQGALGIDEVGASYKVFLVPF